MKAVMLSIRPQWCEKIFNGSKTIEVRKSRPSLDMPFKVYVYETKAQFVKSVRGACTTYGYGRGKVIGSFVCCGCMRPNNSLSLMAVKSLLTIEELFEYSNGKALYGWHITEPKLFEKPIELGEFCVPCKKYNDSELHCMEWGCEHYSFFSCANGDAEEECLCNGHKPLRRPPQSYCYVEVENDT